MAILSCSAPASTNANYPSLDSVWKNPQLTVEATRWLYDRGSRMHGVEGGSGSPVRASAIVND
jgi:hypothetical protein